MKFTCSININAPIKLVANIFEDPDQQKHFQDGFISKVHISGEKGKAGAVSQLNYKRLKLIETLIKNNLPNEFMALYEHKHTTNTMHVSFISIDDFNTQYTTDIEYTKFNGFVVNIMAKLAPSLFKKQVQKWLNQFKYYVESQQLKNQN